MNFDSTYDSVSTLAHEIGHSINSIYFNKAQKVYAETTIFTAEIPSILNEVLLGLYMINKYKNNKNLKDNYIREICGNFFNTTTAQVCLSNFEYEANKLVNESKPFAKETLKHLYKEMLLKYSTNKIKNRKEPYSYAQGSFLRISHFYAGNFYLYKYAVGEIVAVCLANKIINKEKGIMDKFFKFLESGTSRPPLETIKLLGIDLNTKQPYLEALTFIEKMLKLYK
jgi:oligoendopeptidase F